MVTAPSRPPEFLTAEEFAQTFRVDHKTATRWLKDGRVPGAVRLPNDRGDWRIPSKTVAGLWLSGYSPADPAAQAELAGELRQRMEAELL